MSTSRRFLSRTCRALVPALAALPALAAGLQAGENGYLAHSSLTDELVAVVGGERTGFLRLAGVRPHIEERLCIGFLTTSTNEFHVHLPSSPTYAAQIELRDSAGKLVPKTTVGNKYGTRFAELRKFSDTRMTAQGVDRIQSPPGGSPPAVALLRITDCFKLRQAGDYHLTLRVQVFRRRLGAVTDLRLVRFPPFEVPVYYDGPPSGTGADHRLTTTLGLLLLVAAGWVIYRSRFCGKRGVRGQV